MRSEKGASDEAPATDEAARRPGLAIVAPVHKQAHQPQPHKDAAREWDPYQVWRRRVRPDSDAA